MILRSGYFSDFKDGPTMLFWGDADAMRQLASVLRASAIGAGTLALDSVVEAADGRSIVLKTVPKAEGMQVIGDRLGQRHLEWLLDAETMNWFAELLEHLADSGGPGHQYLESQVFEELTVMAACDEYAADLRPD